MTWPASVRDVGAWLTAHPQVVAIKAPPDVVERYVREMTDHARLLPVAGWQQPGFTWRGRQAVICDWADWSIARQMVRR